MSKKAITEIDLGYGKLLAEASRDPDFREIYVYLADADNCFVQDLAVVREAKTKELSRIKHQYEVLVYSDDTNEDYTHQFQIKEAEGLLPAEAKVDECRELCGREITDTDLFIRDVFGEDIIWSEEALEGGEDGYNIYLTPACNVDEILGLNVCTADNDDWVNIYINASADGARIDPFLSVIINYADGRCEFAKRTLSDVEHLRIKRIVQRAFIQWLEAACTETEQALVKVARKVESAAKEPANLYGDEEGICPICGTPVQYLEAPVADEAGTTTSWECQNCGTTGVEACTAVFDHHLHVSDRTGNLVPDRDGY